MFISVCGVEGSGKTTQIKNMACFLNDIGKQYIITREPGGTEIGKKIRKILLDPDNTNLVPKAELFLYAADRAQHIEQIIKPNLQKGKIVISDRYVDSTTVYQGYARGIDFDLIYKINQIVTNGLMPDITFLLDLSPKIGLARAWQEFKNGSRAQDESRFEQENLDFHEKIRFGFLDLAKKDPKRFFVIDASKNIQEVNLQLKTILKEKLYDSKIKS